jgi:plasmid stabilization system protein ParE
VSGVPPLTVTFHRLAAAEYRQALNWYARRNVTTAQRFRDAVDATVARIAAAPQLGAPIQVWYRWARVRRFPYLLYYEQITPTEVMVLAVAHQRRRAGYWRRRSP